MKLAHRLFGGVGAAALAATAADVIDDEDTTAAPAPGAAAGDPEDEDDEQPPAAAVEPTPGAEATDPPAGQAAEPPVAEATELSARDLEMQAAGRAEMHERIDAVFASEHVAGREQAAAMLLSADVAADKIVAKLGTLPKGQAGNDMLASLKAAAAQAPELKPGTGEQDAKAQSKGVWDRVAVRQGWDDKTK